MRLALSLGYLSGRTNPADRLALAQEADRLGLAAVWVAEAYGSDAATLLAWLAAQTERIDLGSAIFQIPARTPTMTAMTAASLDLLSGGRFRLGLGVSGPQVSEGWYGVPFAKPLARTREYLEVIAKALARETVEYAGEHHTLPVPGGPGKPLKLMLHPHRERIPTYLAAIGPKNLELAGELTDGLLAVFWAPEFADEQLASIRAGRERGGRAGEPFDVVPSVPLVIGDDVEKAAEPVRPYSALYVGGMGSREKNFYNALAVRMGYGDAAREVQDLYLAKKQRDAAAAVPLEFIDRTSLLGPVDRVADRMREFAASGVTTLSLAIHAPDLEASIRQLRLAAEAYEKSGVA
ncbi:LLM class F420-dependent oxidoreductase [Virgisporangium aurantiacum]|uniref:LLM class F420-dependent oxidoreductase n=1 Tax=Virgisporangium aurantiacum TaxID=175570 RepID=A0A8J4DZS1_9ACTN|nr:LLM class F420-dependent oxidoreductase [Virgisporangium aurantiacum]GIJ56229.1 LLM class F420-dependent oxidoreductase [Virgisporangium aurantiacum]